MKKMILMNLILLMIPALLLAQFPAYQLFDKDGDETDFEELAEAAAEADVILFGEMHNNPVCHWLQLELAKALHKEEGGFVLGGEMFEADDQVKIDEYLDGFISQKSFEKEARLWKNYDTDYKPLLELAKEHDYGFVATNIPRRYASLVSKRGFEALDSLSPGAKKWIAPLPIEVDLDLPGYKAMEEMFGGHGMAAMKKDTAQADSSSNKPEMPPAMMKAMKKQKNVMSGKMTRFKQAQAVKDATMAHFILNNLKPGSPFLHFNGTYHSKNFEGIVWFLQKARPDLKILTIHSEQQESIEEVGEESAGLADFILIVDEDMTKTY